MSRSFPRATLAAGLAALLLGFSQSAPAQDACDRACLKETLDAYLAALIANDPASAPLASIYRHTENDVVQPSGEGLWTTAAQFGALQRQYFDEVRQNAVFYGIITEDDGGRAVAAGRFHIEGGEVLEAEWWVGREDDLGVTGEGSRTLWDPDRLAAVNRPPNRVVPPSERVTREELIHIANSYWDGVVDRNPDIAIAHPGCFRDENGQATTGNELPPERAGDGGLNGRSDCRSGTSTFNVQNVTARRWHVVDVEQQVVVASALFIREPGHAKRRNHFCDVFAIDGGKLRGLWTAMYYVPPTRPVPNWPPYEGNFPLPAGFGETR